MHFGRNDAYDVRDRFGLEEFPAREWHLELVLHFQRQSGEGERVDVKGQVESQIVHGSEPRGVDFQQLRLQHMPIRTPGIIRTRYATSLASVTAQSCEVLDILRRAASFISLKRRNATSCRSRSGLCESVQQIHRITAIAMTNHGHDMLAYRLVPGEHGSRRARSMPLTLPLFVAVNRKDRW